MQQSVALDPRVTQTRFGGRMRRATNSPIPTTERLAQQADGTSRIPFADQPKPVGPTVHGTATGVSARDEESPTDKARKPELQHRPRVSRRWRCRTDALLQHLDRGSGNDDMRFRLHAAIVLQRPHPGDGRSERGALYHSNVVEPLPLRVGRARMPPVGLAPCATRR